MNKVILTGRLTSEPKIVGTEKKAAHFRIAVDRRFKRDGEDAADFLSCTAFGKTAEFVQYYLHKGTKVGVDGRIQTGSYEKDGRRVYTTDVIVENVEFMESRREQEKAAPADGWLDIPEGLQEELPFA
jgi:single-strand DNA-binding protein